MNAAIWPTIVAAGAINPMGTPNQPLVKYLRDNVAKGVSHFALCASLSHKTGDIEFYIHPAHVSGDTQDFVITEDPENEDYDFIFNKKSGLTDEQVEAGLKKLLASFKKPDAPL